MYTIRSLLRRRAIRNLLIGAVALTLLLTARIVVRGIEADMRANPERLPPAWQIRRQQGQMAREVLADDDVGFLLPSNQTQLVESDDYTATRTVDRQGFPNPGPWLEQADIVFLGDSMLLGEGVGMTGGFVSLIHAELSATSIVNLGNPGAGPERQYRIYRRFGVSLHPRLVVACLLLAYDLDNDTHFASWLEDPLGMDYNEYRLGFTRRNETRPRYHPVRRLERHPLYSWTQSLVEPLLWGEYEVIHRVDIADGSTLLLDRSKVQFARRSFSGNEADFNRLTDALGRLDALVQQGGARLLVLLLPSKEEVYTTQPDDDQGAAEVVRQVLRDRGIELLDLYPVLREARSDVAAYFKRDLHLNAYGNRLVADTFLSSYN